VPIERSKEWWLARIDGEPDGPIGAGSIPTSSGDGFTATSAGEGATTTFAEFVHLLRRREGLSVDQFANAVNIELSEAQAIEEDPYYCVEARTVWYIAQKFSFSQSKLNALAGVVVANDIDPHIAQERFAARSELRVRLSSYEIDLLNAVVAVIQDQVDRARA
jgi:HTH-type transcriptional regulator, competence development regulator